ncbi:MAG: DUF2085 domain-containing protein [Chloroflexi bacterium]|nr:DUF2085 domain-containing protein [Chloroflexota bacterium]MCL5952717.1 DUF2085 domain-containing protein [Chloroflexota bacterium]
MYVGFLVTWGYLILLGRGRARGMPPPWLMFVLVAFVAIMGADGVNAFLYDLRVVPHLYTPRLELRLATGLLCGIAFAGFLVPVVNYSLWREIDPRPAMSGWKELAGALGLAAVLFVINESRIGLFFYPFAIVTSASVIILIALINLVFVLSLFRQEGSAVTWRDALNPFAAGVVLALLELGALSLLRYGVLGTTVLP